MFLSRKERQFTAFADIKKAADSETNFWGCLSFPRLPPMFKKIVIDILTSAPIEIVLVAGTVDLVPSTEAKVAPRVQ